MQPTYYPKTKEALNAIYQEHNIELTDFWCSSDALPEWIDEIPAPDGQSKVIDRDGNINLDPCRIILDTNSAKILIEVPLTIYEDWIDADMIRNGLDPRTGNPAQ